MKLPKSRIINIRVTFVCFAGLMTGILFSYFFLLTNFSLLKALIFAVIMVLLVVACYFYAVATEKHNKRCEFRVGISGLIKIASIAWLVAFVIGSVIISIPLSKITALKRYSAEVEVSGVVSDYVVDKSNYKKFILDKCVVDDRDIDFKIIVYTSNYVDINLGDNVTVNTMLDRYELENTDGFVKLTQGIGYSSYVQFDNITSVNGKRSLKDIVKSNVREVLEDNLSQDNANISYGILFGEKQGVNQDITQAFSYAGISHILAVSGLHIGVLFALFYRTLKKLKVNNWVSFVILCGVILFYSYLCEFTPSVSRASIMVILVALCDMFAIEYDIISSLSIAGIIILLFNPISLFSVSFQLSFLCIFAIIALAPFLTRLIKKIKLPEFLASGLAVSIATNLVIMPICLNTFDKVSLLGVFTNILVLPIFSVAYVLLFVVTLLVMIFKFAGFLFILPDLFLHLIKVIAGISANLPFGIFKAFNISYMGLFILVVTCLILHFLMIRKWHKGVICGILLGVIVAFFVSGIIPKKYSGDNLILSYNINESVVIYVEDNNVTLIGSNIKYYNLSKIMKDLKMKHIDNIIAYDLELNKLDELKEISNEYQVKNIYIHESFNYPVFDNGFNNIIYYANSVKIHDLRVDLFDIDNQSGYYIEANNIGTLLNINSERFIIENDLNDMYKDVDYLLIPYKFSETVMKEFNATKVICNDYAEFSADYFVNLKLCDKIYLSGE